MADGSAKLSGRDYEFHEPTLRREFTVRRENLSGESHGDGKGFDLKNKKMTQKIGNNWEKSRILHKISHIEPRVQRTCREKTHSLFPRCTVLNETLPKKKRNTR